MTDEQKKDLLAVQRLIENAYEALEAAAAEVTLRKIDGASWAVGAIGAAQAAASFARRMVQAARGELG